MHKILYDNLINDFVVLSSDYWADDDAALLSRCHGAIQIPNAITWCYEPVTGHCGLS